MFTQFVAVALCALAAQPAMAGSCSRTYTIRPGDICDSICAANNVPTYQLAVNNMNTIDSSCSNLQPGGTLCLGTVGEDCHTTHVVKLNDTCDVISSAAGISNKMLTTNNPQINADCTNIYIGEVLCTANAVLVTNAPSAPAATVAAALASSAENLPYCDEL